MRVAGTARTMLVRARDSSIGAPARRICAARSAARCLVVMYSYAMALREKLTVQIIGGKFFAVTKSTMIRSSVKIDWIKLCLHLRRMISV